MRPSIVLSGFFGRGNCGDEAILQVQYERLHREFDIIISLDHHDAYDGFWDWYPYNQCELIHSSNLNVFAVKNVVGLHVGGGGLPWGFNGAQVVAAASHSKSVVMTGVDLPPIDASGSSAVQAKYLNLFSGIAPRTQQSWRRLQALGVQSPVDTRPGIDWAYGLPCDDQADRLAKDKTLVVLRELPAKQLRADYKAQLESLLGDLKAHFERDLVLLPFCPEDERFLEQINLNQDYVCLRHWWNPRQMQAIIRSAALVVSIGRLHPLIMSQNVGTPACYVEPRGGGTHGVVMSKVVDITAEAHLPYFASFEDARQRLRTENFKSCDSHSILEFEHRLNDQLSLVLKHFSTQRISAE